MKTFNIFCASPVLLMVALATPAVAQTQPTKPVAQGYWNIESNLRSREISTVRFYNDQHALVHEVQVPRQSLNLCRRRISPRTIKQLNVALQQVMGGSQTTAYSRTVGLLLAPPHVD